MNENTKEKIGCFAIILFILFMMIVFKAISNSKIDEGFDKMTYCSDEGLTADQCRQQWDTIKVKGE